MRPHSHRASRLCSATWLRPRHSLLVFGLVISSAWGCGPKHAEETMGGLGGGCRQEAAEVDGKLSEVAGLVEESAALFGADAAMFGPLQSGLRLVERQLGDDAAHLCSALDEGAGAAGELARKKACLGDASAALDVLRQRASDPQSVGDARQVAWALEGNLYSLERSVDCAPPPSVDADSVASVERGAERRFRKRSSLHLVEEEVSQDGVEVRLEGYLLCQRLSADGRFEDVMACNRSELTEGDRVKFGFKAAEPAYVYLFGYNDTGQFQMLFPSHGVANRVEPHTQYFLPSGDGWLELDAVGGVREYVQLVASTQPVAELEALRGVEVPPHQEASVQRRTRGLLEPLITRGFRQAGGPITLETGGGAVSTIPVQVSDLDIVGMEFEIQHR